MKALIHHLWILLGVPVIALAVPPNDPLTVPGFKSLLTDPRWEHARGADIDPELGLSVRPEGFGWSTLEQQVSLFPNVKIDRSWGSSLVDLSPDGRAGARDSGRVDFDETRAAASLNQYDTRLYYQLLSDWGNFDFGINLRHIDGTVRSASSERVESRAFHATIPTLYASAMFDLPFEGLSAGVGGSLGRVGENELFDYKASLLYQTDKGFGAQAGWRAQQLQLREFNSLNPELEMRGPFLDLYLKF
jgi:hypothetical protein